MLKRIFIGFFIGCTILPCWLVADGLLLPKDENYPKDFLRNRLTHIALTIDGLVAETVVTQEFINESADTIDAMWNFPLPIDARAFRFRLWYGDTILVAQLKVQQQDPNPGTGTGGVAAEVNRYIGPNGLRIPVQNIPPHSIQRVELSYISICEYHRGQVTYTYPLFSDDFITYPLEHLEMDITLLSSTSITGWSLPLFQDAEAMSDQPDHLNIQAVKAKAYPNSDIVFSYTADNTDLGLDFYAESLDTLGYHFGMVIRPPDTLAATSVVPMRAIFLLSRSSRYVYDYQFEQCKSAIGRFLDGLDESHVFNIVAYASDTESWQTAPVAATQTNITAANAYLNGLTLDSGSDLDNGIRTSFLQFTDGVYNNTLVLLTDGQGLIDPKDIALANPHMTAIFPIVFGEHGDIPSMTMLADLNYGFLTTIGPDDNFIEKTDNFFQRVRQPMMKDVILEYGKTDIRDLIHAQIPALYAGSYTYITGRYDSPSISPFSIAGVSAAGAATYDFMLDFTPDTARQPMMAYIWAKDRIDALEREILIYGVDEELKQEMIDISLAYGIRCMYTAYILEYPVDDGTTVSVTSDTPPLPVRSALIKNYPNPFNSGTVINVLLPSDVNSGHTSNIRIYDLRGRLVRIIDLGHLSSGSHAVRFDGLDVFGRELPSGIYFLVLQVGNSFDYMRITLLR
jgi:hypothetical protein